MKQQGRIALTGIAALAVSFAGVDMATATSPATTGTAVAKVAFRVTPNPATHTSPVALFSAVRPYPASTTAAHPSGTVCFFDGAASTPITCGALTVSSKGVSSARVKVTLTAGGHSIQARYSGDATYAAAVSKAVYVQVS